VPDVIHAVMKPMKRHGTLTKLSVSSPRWLGLNLLMPDFLVPTNNGSSGVDYRHRNGHNGGGS